MKYMEFADAPGNSEGWERLITVLDISDSMGGTDWRPSRLHGAIEAAAALLLVKASQHPNDEVGVVSFSTHSKTVHPPVRLADGLKSLNQALKTLKPDSSTNITAGLAEAEANFFEERARLRRRRGALDPGGLLEKIMGVSAVPPPAPETSQGMLRRVILLTDGEHNCGGDPVLLAARLKDAGVVIDCVGIGGSPKHVDERRLRAVASSNGDGSPRYCFIGDKEMLIKKFEQLGNRIKLA
jgi:hypothetical protein